MGTHALLQSLCPKSQSIPFAGLLRRCSGFFCMRRCTLPFSALCARPARRIVAFFCGLPIRPLPQRTKRGRKEGMCFAFGTGKGLSGAVRGGPGTLVFPQGGAKGRSASQYGRFTRARQCDPQAVSERLGKRRRKEEGEASERKKPELGRQIVPYLWEEAVRFRFRGMPVRQRRPSAGVS